VCILLTDLDTSSRTEKEKQQLAPDLKIMGLSRKTRQLQ
jgi:hypothetical protein